MKRNTLIPLLAGLVFILCVNVNSAFAQKNNDSTYYKNSIKFNITNWILYDNVFMFSYERVVSKHQTFSVTGGYVEMPGFLPNQTGVKYHGDVSKSGFTIGGDYRFYLAAENKFPAPHGLYIGPYISYYDFKSERRMAYTDTTGSTSTAIINSKINVGNLGVQLGYQFILSKRITIDLTLFAPSFSRYGIHLDATGSLSDHAKEIIYNDVTQAVIDRFPLLDKLLTDKHVDASGSRNALAPGLKYCVYIGYHFGKR
ncbi:DUF3575 domain-containing protein [Pinibacter soli]|uniref:DUF3575 domain-containing protein n=1 Tax=Pinibacter soli TaxID=3044211 RepID=A0ABT6RIB5_9BACT|nr:DUF3575 domain-containing protein [Pinibacter soli]MDI3322216.1 DUF3575 domain-containing protein [Pinibacter soli]